VDRGGVGVGVYGMDEGVGVVGADVGGERFGDRSLLLLLYCTGLCCTPHRK
jgi:hypothetical protein